MQSRATKLARSSVWPYKGQDRRAIFKLLRVTPASGTKSDYIFNSEIVKPPVPGKNTHYYLLPTNMFEKWTSIELNNHLKSHKGVWLSLKDNWDAFNINFDVYTYTGISVPISMVYYRVSNNGAMHLALVEDFSLCKINPEVDTMYVKLYDNIYYSSGFGDIGQFRYYGIKVTQMTEVAALVTTQSTLDLSKCLCFKNGYLIDSHDVAKTQVGDHIEIYQDGSIDFKSVNAISDMPYYMSTADQCTKFVFTINNDGVVSNQQRYFVDDISFYLYNTDKNIGVYLHTNQKKNIINLTHNVFAVASDYLNDVSEKNGSDFELSKCSILAVCKKDNTVIPALNTTLCLHDLYYMAFTDSGLDPKEIARLICSPATLEQWRGNSLETGIYKQFMDSNYGKSDLLAKDLVGYHSLFDVYGKSFQKLNLGYKVPDLFVENFTLQPFNDQGVAIKDGMFKSSYMRPFSKAYAIDSPMSLDATDFSGVLPDSIRYYPKLKSTQYSCTVTDSNDSSSLEDVPHPLFENDFGAYDSHKTVSTVELKKYRDYRVYYKGTLEKYYRPAELGVHYTVSGSTLTWLTNSASIHTCIRDSEDGYCFNATVTLDNSSTRKKRNSKVFIKYTPVVLNGHISVGSIPVSPEYVKRHEDVLWGYIHVYFNGARLIENVDYCIDRDNGHIVIYSEQALLNDTANQTYDFTVYCFGHPDENMGRVKALEFGVVYKSLISNNAKYESYKYRNTAMVIGGRTVALDDPDYKFADENTTNNLLTSHNGQFYLIEDSYYDVGHMYQSHLGFDTAAQMKKEHDYRVKTALAINAAKVNDPVTGIDISLNRTVLVSAFLNSFILAVVYDEYPIGDVNHIDVNLHRQQIVNLYSSLYSIDPVVRINTDLSQFKQHIDIYPTYCNYAVAMSLDKYKFVKEMVRIFCPDIDINRFITITN